MRPYIETVFFFRIHSNDRAGANFLHIIMLQTCMIQSITMYESNKQQSVVGSHTSVDDSKSTAMHSRYSVNNISGKEMRQTV